MHVLQIKVILRLVLKCYLLMIIAEKKFKYCGQLLW